MTLRILPRRCRAEKGSESLSCPAIASRVTARRNEHTDAMMSSRERKRHLHCPSWRESAKVTSLAPVSPTPIGAVKVIRAERPEFYNGDTIILAGTKTASSTAIIGFIAYRFPVKGRWIPAPTPGVAA
ncbi:hypothetical protein M747DRAFT_136814 [Aspergillus niger ATCC 13496]|uniref:Uncharacterized protein n=1 Tax=Aspergillus niger ATCC 13496 TaxID=1353008 RepID=A0A370C8A7_ASPNG|nr:hypothetical protein M747DRAFT_136814 [Aspergillus niger ATCC 13496]